MDKYKNTVFFFSAILSTTVLLYYNLSLTTETNNAIVYFGSEPLNRGILILLLYLLAESYPKSAIILFPAVLFFLIDSTIFTQEENKTFGRLRLNQKEIYNM